MIILHKKTDVFLFSQKYIDFLIQVWFFYSPPTHTPYTPPLSGAESGASARVRVHGININKHTIQLNTAVLLLLLSAWV